MKYLCAFLMIISPSLAASAETLEIYCEETPPYQMRAGDGAVHGVVVDIVREIQKRTGNSDAIQIVPWNRGYTFALQKKNTVLFSVVMTDDRKDLFRWVGPVMDFSMAFYARKDSAIRISSLAEAKKVKGIAVYGNDIGQQYLEKNGFTNLVKTYDNASAQKDLLLGRVDLVSIGRCSRRRRVEGTDSGGIKEVFVYMHNPIYIAFSKSSSPETVASWNRALAAMKKDGTFDAICGRYFTD